MKTDWNDKKETRKYIIPWSDCDIYDFYGTFGSCNSHDSPICSCLRGFQPRNIEEWNRENWASGCVRNTALQCEGVKNASETGKGDRFLKLQNIKVLDFVEQSSVSEDNCKDQCLENCSCMAYAYDAGIGCMSWGGNLLDIQRFSTGGADLYIRLVHSELGRLFFLVINDLLFILLFHAQIVSFLMFQLLFIQIIEEHK